MEKQHILQIFQDAIAEISPYAVEILTQVERGKNPDPLLIELGINSIDYAQIANIVMDKLSIDAALDIFTCTNRVSEVVEIFHRLSIAQEV